SIALSSHRYLGIYFTSNLLHCVSVGVIVVCRFGPFLVLDVFFFQAEDGIRDFHVTGVQTFFFSSRRRHTRFSRDWSSDVCSSDLWRAGRQCRAISSSSSDSSAQLTKGVWIPCLCRQIWRRC